MVRIARAWTLLAAGLIGAGLAGAAPDGRPVRVPEIRVQKGDWGDAGTGDIRAVLASAAAQLVPPFADRAIAPIVVTRCKGSPITYYRRGPAGEFRVGLDVEGAYWCQFAYQFAHELGHVLCRFSRPDDPEDVDPQNFWLEESLCEAAALHALRGMAKDWRVRPPHPNWKGYATSIDRYVAERLERGRLPEGKTPAAWFREAEPEMRKNAELRKRNAVVAVAILPLLEKEPARWASVAWLPRKAAAPRSFRQYLQDWQAAAPAEHRAFIAAVGRALDVGV